MQGNMGRTPSTASLRPEIPEALPNITVAVGREAILPCVVKNLKDYKVQRFSVAMKRYYPSSDNTNNSTRFCLTSNLHCFRSHLFT